LTVKFVKSGLKTAQRKFNHDASLAAPKRDFKSAEFKRKESDQDEMSSTKQKKKSKPSAKDKFSMSVQDMLEEGERFHQLLYNNIYESDT
jgi:hypothetical protein